MACKCAAGTCHDKCPCLHCQYSKQLVQIDAHVLVVYLVGVPFLHQQGSGAACVLAIWDLD